LKTSFSFTDGIEEDDPESDGRRDAEIRDSEHSTAILSFQDNFIYLGTRKWPE
jgi:hypothetical protein